MKDLFTLKQIKIAVYVAIFALASMLFLKWEAVNAPSPAVPASQTSSTASVSSVTGSSALKGVSLPVEATPAQAPPSVTQTAPAQTGLITVSTPLFQVKINPVGGDIVEGVLNHYQQSLNSQAPFVLLHQDVATPNALQYIVQSGLVAADNRLPSTLIFTSTATQYTLGTGQELKVDLTWTDHAGLSIVKSYTFFPNQYVVPVTYTITNTGKTMWSGRFYGELTRNAPAASETGFFHSYTSYTGAAVSSPADHYQKLSFADMAENNFEQTVSSGWVAMLQHYFITAWVPINHTPITQFSTVNNGLYSIGLATPTVNVAPGAVASTGATLYLGPAIADHLKTVAPYLDKTIDYGWLWFISELIFGVMKWIYAYVGNWGAAIILVTVLIKLVFYPLSAKSYTSMAKMRELQPKIKLLREKFGEDRQKIGVATMELYRKEKVNPLGGCLPILVQIPVFIALYWVLMESVELRQAPFIFWIHDLSVKDPYYVLPILMGLSMFAQQRLNPAPPDPIQAKMMMFLPLIFTVMFLSFPSGLVLYWLVNNCLSIAQQAWVMGRYHRRALKRGAGKTE